MDPNSIELTDLRPQHNSNSIVQVYYSPVQVELVPPPVRFQFNLNALSPSTCLLKWYGCQLK